MNILGITAYFHDSSACLMQAGQLVAAAEEERFTRKKHESDLPVQAARYCLEQAGLTIADVDKVAWFEQPIPKLARQIWMGLPNWPWRGEQHARMDAQRPQREMRQRMGYEGEIDYVSHHQAHAASAYYYSGFTEAAIMTVDGVGEWETTSYGYGDQTGMHTLATVQFPDSLGLLYSTITAYLGFKVNNDEYKVMGLAPYGQPRYVTEMRKLITNGSGGDYQLDMQYFEYMSGQRMYSEALIDLFGHPPRQRETEVKAQHQDIAHSLQKVLEEILYEKMNWLHEQKPIDKLCMAGGVALNCVANGKIRTRTPYRQVFIQPAANDAGGALGAAAEVHARSTGQKPKTGPMTHVYLGPSYTAEQVKAMLDRTPVAYTEYTARTGTMIEEAAARLDRGQVLGWYQGRMEFGPRALGARSILADPRRENMRDHINSLVKKREAFRPFAPVVPEELAHKYFDLDHPSPFMLETSTVRTPIPLPAITHVDQTARVQTTNAQTNPRYTELLYAYYRLTGIPVLLNTSFNMRGEPIVCTPEEALACFVRAQIDALVIEDIIIDRQDIPAYWKRGLDIMYVRQQEAINHRVYTFL